MSLWESISLFGLDLVRTKVPVVTQAGRADDLRCSRPDLKWTPLSLKINGLCCSSIFRVLVYKITLFPAKELDPGLIQDFVRRSLTRRRAWWKKTARKMFVIWNETGHVFGAFVHVQRVALKIASQPHWRTVETFTKLQSSGHVERRIRLIKTETLWTVIWNP